MFCFSLAKNKRMFTYLNEKIIVKMKIDITPAQSKFSNT